MSISTKVLSHRFIDTHPLWSIERALQPHDRPSVQTLIYLDDFLAALQIIGMAEQAVPARAADLNAPCTTDTIVELRMGKIKPLPGLTILSGIDKTMCSGPMRVTNMGIEGDEHDYTFHGGPDKAIHACKSSPRPYKANSHLPAPITVNMNDCV